MQDKNIVSKTEFDRWLDIKEKEIESNSLEAKLRFQQDANQYEYAKKVLDAKSSGMSEKFRHEQTTEKYRLVFSGFIALMVFSVI